MLEIRQIPEQTQGILERGLTKLKEDAARNMQSNDQVVTGKTLNSMRVETDGNTGALYGADHIDTLEIGISPERSRVQSWNAKFASFNTWQQARGFAWTQRQIARAVSIQQEQGSIMHRFGITKNVYSEQIEPMVEQIKNELGDVFLNVKIVR